MAATLSLETTEPGEGQARISAPATVEGGVVKVSLKNSGTRPHDAQLARIEGSRSQEEVVHVLSSRESPIPDWLFWEGGVGVTSPGTSRSATLVLPPGEYFILDTQSGETGNSYAEEGAVRPLNVSISDEPGGTVARSAEVVTAQDYRFTVPPLRAGTTEITFDNVGDQPHLVVAAPLAPGKTIDDVKAAYFEGEQAEAGPPPVDFAKATTVAALEGTKALTTTISLEKGNYAFICFLTDRGGGPPHFSLGMLQESAVT